MDALARYTKEVRDYAPRGQGEEMSRITKPTKYVVDESMFDKPLKRQDYERIWRLWRSAKLTGTEDMCARIAAKTGLFVDQVRIVLFPDSATFADICRLFGYKFAWCDTGEKTRSSTYIRSVYGHGKRFGKSWAVEFNRYTSNWAIRSITIGLNQPIFASIDSGWGAVKLLEALHNVKYDAPNMSEFEEAELALYHMGCSLERRAKGYVVNYLGGHPSHEDKANNLKAAILVGGYMKTVIDNWDQENYPVQDLNSWVEDGEKLPE